MPTAETPTIRHEEFVRFRDYLYRRTGMYFDESKRYFVDRRILDRMRATGSDSFTTWFAHLRFDASSEEYQAIVNALTTNETYFFRESYQFDAMVGGLLDEIVAQRRREAAGTPTLRIWVMPSSTGEEAYSIAITLLERWDAIQQIDVELVGSDIDTDVLERARQGCYSPRSVQNVPKELLTRYFEPLPDGAMQVCEDLRQSVDFDRANLTNLPPGRYRNFDLIFCRNLLIYFDQTSRQQAAQALFDALRPGGFLFLGHSESMSRVSSLFRVRKLAHSIAYQKPGRGDAPSPDRR